MKPVVLITARVHPGETSSSFCLMGIIETLLHPKCLQSYLLRRMFEWKIVPMVNPDGVVSGNYRTDPRGDNLNRNYLQPNINLHPAIYRVVQLMKQLCNNDRKIEFYLDLHSHSCLKEGFIYGNALDNILAQAHSQLFCKILEQNTTFFRSNLSLFGEKHMNFKDKAQKMTKQGCGRVVAWKLAKVVASYTLESTVLPFYYYKNIKCELKPIKNQKFAYHPLDYEEALIFQQQKFRNNQSHLLIQANKKLGQAVLISILDFHQKNPYTRLTTDFTEKQYLLLRKKLLRNQQRFKLKDIYQSCRLKMGNQQIIAQYEKDQLVNWQKFNFFHQLSRCRCWPVQFKIIINTKEKIVDKIGKRETKLNKIEQTLLNYEEKNENQSSLESKEDRLSKITIKLQQKKLHNSNKLIFLNFQGRQSGANIQLSEFSKRQNPPSFANCFGSQQRQYLRKLKRWEINKIPQQLVRSQNAAQIQDEFRKNTQKIKSFKEWGPLRKSQGKQLEQSLSKSKRGNVGNNYLYFLQRQKRTKTQSKNQIDLIPNISLPRSYSSLNNKLVPNYNAQSNKDKTMQSLAKAQAAYSLKKSLKFGLNLPYLEGSKIISSSDRYLFNEKKQ